MKVEHWTEQNNSIRAAMVKKRKFPFYGRQYWLTVLGKQIYGFLVAHINHSSIRGKCVKSCSAKSISATWHFGRLFSSTNPTILTRDSLSLSVSFHLSLCFQPLCALHIPVQYGNISITILISWNLMPRLTLRLNFYISIFNWCQRMENILVRKVICWNRNTCNFMIV